MKWKKRALAALLAALCLLTACGEGGLGGDDGPVDTVEVSDAYFGMAWYPVSYTHLTGVCPLFPACRGYLA